MLESYLSDIPTIQLQYIITYKFEVEDWTRKLVGLPLNKFYTFLLIKF